MGPRNRRPGGEEDRVADARTHVSFDAAQFAVPDGAEGSVAGDLGALLPSAGPPAGKDLADALGTALRQRGFQCSSTEKHDQFMWRLDVSEAQKHWLLGAGHVGDPDIGQWLVFVEPRGTWTRLGRLRRVPLRWSFADLAAALHSVIVSGFGARPQWYTKQEWMAGPRGPGAPAP